MIILLNSQNEYVEDLSDRFQTVVEAEDSYGSTLGDHSIIESDKVEGLMKKWKYIDGTWHKPTKDGAEWDIKDERFYAHNQYREILHQRTSNDTLQALRKLREGDQSYDWQAWLDKLDAYNKAIEDTQLQETYPDKVVYPEYPQK